MIVRETRGYCPCCKQETTFLAENFWLRDFYICTKCGSIPRQRALMKVLREFCPDLKKIRIHESSPSPEMIARMRSEADNYSFSYCYDDMPLGAILENGGTNENLERLTLPDESVDVFITQDVMEHICSPNKAFREIERVLSTGGGTHIYHARTFIF